MRNPSGFCGRSSVWKNDLAFTFAASRFSAGKTTWPLSTAVLVLATMHDASAFGARFSWSGISACGRTSPAFTIRDAPKGTESLRFMMSDQDAPSFRHGGSTIPYDGSGRVPEGAIDYIGPCPPAGVRHRYVWRIEALDKSGKIIAHTTTEGRFPVR
jgi:phosphatidylethanolamine-binding protein (PEBP) family uncharacterized protein